MSPVNALLNIHLFRDYYHLPTFQSLNTSNGVQAETLKGLMFLWSFFLQFLRKYQVFAGISRDQIRILEQCVNYFNKELNPHVKQRKVDV